MDSAERRRSETDIGGGPRSSADARPSLDLSSDPMLESNLALRKLSEAFGKFWICLLLSILLFFLLSSTS